MLSRMKNIKEIPETSLSIAHQAQRFSLWCGGVLLSHG